MLLGLVNHIVCHGSVVLFQRSFLVSVCTLELLDSLSISIIPPLPPDVSGWRGVGWTFQSRSSSALRGMTIGNMVRVHLNWNRLSEMRAVHLLKLSKLAFEWHYCLSNLIYVGFKLKERNKLGVISYWL